AGGGRGSDHQVVTELVGNDRGVRRRVGERGNPGRRLRATGRHSLGLLGRGLVGGRLLIDRLRRGAGLRDSAAQRLGAGGGADGGKRVKRRGQRLDAAGQDLEAGHSVIGDVLVISQGVELRQRPGLERHELVARQRREVLGKDHSLVRVHSYLLCERGRSCLTMCCGQQQLYYAVAHRATDLG